MDVEAQSQAVFGTGNGGRTRRQSLEIPNFSRPKIASATVRALSERWNAGSLGRMQAVLSEDGATQSRREGRDPGRQGEARRVLGPGPAPALASRTGSRSRPGRQPVGHAKDPHGTGAGRTERPPGRMPARAPVRKPSGLAAPPGEAAEGQDIGRQARCLERARTTVRRNSRPQKRATTRR